MPIVKIVPMPGPQGPAGNGEGGDLTVPTAIKDNNGDDLITFERTGTGTARIGTPQDDLSLRSARDITLIAGDDGPGNVYIGWGDATIAPDATNRVATIADIQQGTTGDITFEGSAIIGNGTMSLVPDADLLTNEYSQNQYLIIDPTAPNHIHIRAGGNIDESTAELILGGERNKVSVSDSSKSVAINTAAIIENTFVNANEVNNADLMVPDTSDILIGDNIVMFGTSYPVTYFSPDPNNTGFSIVRATGATFVAGDSYTFVREEPYDHSWQFGSNGYLYGPAMGGLFVSGLINGESDLWIYSNDSVVLNSGDGGEFLNDPNTPGNQIAKLSDIRVDVPTASIGQAGDVFGKSADDATYHYFCTGTYDGTTNIWKRIAWSNDTWPGV